jgi:hypothetical protein
MIELTKEQITVDIETDPEYWVDFILEQDKTITELNNLIEEFKARLELAMRIPPNELH